MLSNILTVCILFHVFSIDFRNFGCYLWLNIYDDREIYLNFTCMLYIFYEFYHLVMYLYDVILVNVCNILNLCIT